MEPTLSEHLAGLCAAVEQYRSATAKAEQHLASQIEALWLDSAERRDELHTAVTALSNRIEANTPAAIFRCDPDESGGVRDDDAA